MIVVMKSLISKNEEILWKYTYRCFTFEETLLMMSHKHIFKVFLFQNSDKFIVPDNHYFFWVTTETVLKIIDFF